MRRRIIAAAAAAMALMFLLPASADARKMYRDLGTGLSVGYTYSSYRTLDWATDEVVDKSGLHGLNIGATHDITLLRDALYLQTGLNYIYLNDSRKETLLGMKLVGDRTEHNLVIPARLKYMFPINSDICVYAFGGPSFQVGLVSDLVFRTRISEDKAAALSYDYYTGKVHTKNAPDSMSDWFENQHPEGKRNRVDVLLGGAIGAELYDLIEVQIGYDWGLVNVNRGEDSYDMRTRRQLLYIGVGLRF